MKYHWLQWPQTQKLVEAFSASGADLRFVGGAVRDSLLGRPVVDVDAATPARPEAVQALLEAASIRAIPTGIDHGTITAVIDGKSYEITTLRRDVGSDGRHAIVSFTDSWQEDAARRDFTMNALYLSPNGELFDYFSGQEDARAGHVRFIGNAAHRIEEDYLRILRFFRFQAHYGKGQADGDALAAIRANTSGLKRLSGERICHEMLRLLAADSAADVLSTMLECGVEVFPASVSLSSMRALGRAPALLRLAALIAPEDIKPLAERWKLSGAQKEYLQKLHAALPVSTLSQKEQKALLYRLKKDLFCDVARLAGATGAWPNIDEALTLADSWPVPEFPVRGEDLIAHGMAEGKAIGEVLKKLEALWQESDYSLSKEVLIQQL